MKLFLAFLFFYSLAYADPAPVTRECKDSSKEVKTECSKDNFAQAWADAFNQIPFKYKVIFDDMEKCTKSVALCYYNCGNKTLTKSSSGSAVTGALRKSYGKKPHTAEIINCRGYLSDYAKEIEGTCEAEMIKEKAKLDSKDKGIKDLAAQCRSFANFETPELESKDEYSLAIPPEKASMPQLGPVKYPSAEVDVTTKGRVGNLHAASDSGHKVKIEGQPGVDPLKRINTMNRGEPGGKKKDTEVNPRPQPTNIGMIQNPNLDNIQKAAVKKKKKRRAGESSLKKIGEQLATNTFHGAQPEIDQGAKKFQIAKEKAKIDQIDGNAPHFNGELSGVQSTPFKQGLSSGALGASLFHKNSKAIERLRKSQMTLE